MASPIVTGLLTPIAVPINKPTISPMAQPVRQCRTALAAIVLRAFLLCPFVDTG